MSLYEQKISQDCTRVKEKDSLLGCERRIRGTSLHLQGSYTVEASVVLPVFLCFAVFMLLFLRILSLEWGISVSLDTAVRNIAIYGKEVGTYEGETEGDIGMSAAILYANAEYAKRRVPLNYIRGDMFGIDYSASEFTDNEVTLVAKYRVPLPFTMFGKLDYEMVQHAYARRWTGEEPGKGDSEDDEEVYITPSGTAYHSTRSCTYLDLSIHAVGKGDLASSRNKSGGTYSPCRLCGKRRSGTYYITDYGDSYHTSISCSGLKRTITSVKKSEAIAKGYHACGKCGNAGGL